MRQLQLRCTDATGHSLLDGRCFLGIADKPDPMKCPGWYFGKNSFPDRTNDPFYVIGDVKTHQLCDETGQRDNIEKHLLKRRFDGTIHRCDGPARIVTDFNTGGVHFKEWRYGGSIHRVDDNKPALITYNHVTGKKTSKFWYKYGMLKRKERLVENHWEIVYN